MIFAPIGLLFFLFLGYKIPALENTTTLLGFYSVIYFFLFPFIELCVGNVASFHQKYNRKGIYKQPVRYFIENKNDVVYFYKVIFNVGYAIIVFLVLTHEGL
ncbi:hypothetical protein DFQ50_101376 [Pseudocitrobacter faecalis]|uniref:Uncharacterized protein n=1 Tax=Pseudocitrobacter faecalis TaxID=1398493 RepID=A0ABX9G770_9ENTR|nr:hypothetical protein DFQ50_101376 [Pseudocitrobacter faecalis]